MRKAVHSEFYPAELRPQDGVVFRVRESRGDAEFLQVRPWRLSPLGAEFELSDTLSDVASGSALDIEILISGSRTLHKAVVVDTFPSETSSTLCGVRFVTEPSNERLQNRRTNERWICSDSFLPTCMAATPGRFNDFMYFQVRDISPDGMQLHSSLRNKFLISGTKLNLTMVFPMGSVANMRVEVQRVSVVSVAGRDKLSVGVTYDRLPEFAKAEIGQYLLQFSLNDVSSRELNAVGFGPTSIAAGVDFFSVKSKDDYRKVLELRYHSHSKAGNLRDGVGLKEMSDRFDASSRILAGRYKGMFVATARLQFWTSDEIAEVGTAIAWSKELPKLEEVVEVSRFATHPDFRRGDLLVAMLKICCLNAMQPERPWIVISCLDEMVPLYTKLGFRETGFRRTEFLWKDGYELSVMIARYEEGVLGRGVSPIYWNLAYREVADRMIANGSILPKGIDRLRLLLYRALGVLYRTVVPRKRPRSNAV